MYQGYYQKQEELKTVNAEQILELKTVNAEQIKGLKDDIAQLETQLDQQISKRFNILLLIFGISLVLFYALIYFTIK
ncbi:hypothetical protein HC864_01405 [Candidatus Gracilibacteria bacterium]|nr:hypothetical protein [Candidatus Gracilibacteria bacterium]